jgi:hypothetical protein
MKRTDHGNFESRYYQPGDETLLPPLNDDENEFQHCNEPQIDKAEQAGPPLLSMREFLKGFVPPDYLIDGMLQRRYVYCLTGQTGHAKTALALLVATIVGSREAGAMFGNHAVEQGQVVYLAGENPDDVRMRLLGIDIDLDTHISIIPGVFDIGTMLDRLATEMQRLGKVDLIIVDTSAAYFLGQDENNNPQMGAHARMLRKLTEMPGGPCVLVLCHPIKHVIDPSQLLPRGGGAFLAEMDGNLTAWKQDSLVQLHHNKIRGPGFEPMTFRVEQVKSPNLIDSKGRLIPTVKAVAISEDEEAAEKQSTRDEEDQLLTALAENPNSSMADLARTCEWMWQSGVPAKSRVERVLKRLKDAKLVKQVRGQWVLTDEGKKAAGSKPVAAKKTTSFQPIKVKRLQGIACVHCCKEYGDVFHIRDGRVKNGPAEALHEGCAEAFFRGDFFTKKDEPGGSRQESADAPPAPPGGQQENTSAGESGDGLPPDTKVLGVAAGHRCQLCGSGRNVYLIRRRSGEEAAPMHKDCAIQFWERQSQRSAAAPGAAKDEQNG